jgi:hypothetical protein
VLGYLLGVLRVLGYLLGVLRCGSMPFYPLDLEHGLQFECGALLLWAAVELTIGQMNQANSSKIKLTS